MYKDRKLRQLIVDLQQVMSLYGYQMLSTPIIEEADLFLTKAGDQIAERLFTFERHGHNLALRPEFTASAAYLYVTQGRSDVVRWQFNGPVFEDDPQNDSGHYQQYSIGAELIGMAGTFAEAEIIGMAARGLIEQNITGWRLVIGHVGLTRHLLEQFALDTRTQRFILQRRHLLKGTADGKAQLMAQIDNYLPGDHPQNGTASEAATEADTQKMLDVLLDASQRGETMGGRSRHDIARRLLEKRHQATQRESIEAAVDFLQAWINISAEVPDARTQIQALMAQYDSHEADILYARWLDVLNLMNAYDIPQEKVIIQPDLARTWDYYTGIVFEIRTQDGTQLAGGGRYDGLTRLIGGQNTPAVGYAYYVDHLMATYPEDSLKNALTFGLMSEAADEASLITWANQLRKHDMTVSIGVKGDVSLYMAEDNTLHLDNQSYTLEQINTLIAQLHEKYHDR